MRYLSLLGLAVGAAYFLLTRRRFDLLTVAFFSCAVYFFPLYFGYVAIPSETPGTMLTVPVHEGVLLTAFCVQASLTFAAVWLDTSTRDRPLTVPRATEGLHVLATIATLFAIALFGMTCITMRGNLLLPKEEMLPLINRWLILWQEALVVCTACAYATKRWLLLAVGATMLLFDLYIGFRTSVAISLGVILLLHLGAQPPSRLAVSRWGTMIAAVAVIFLLFVYKQVASTVKLGAWDFVLLQLGDPDLYIDAVKFSEPAATQGVFNEIVTRSFHVSGSHLSAILGHVIFFSPELGLNAVHFNDLFQPVLFPQVTESGLASNIWGEMWSVGDWPLLGVFIGAYVAFATFGAWRFMRASLAGQLVTAHFFLLFVFYVHRNELVFQVYLQKRVIIMWLALLIGVQVLYRSGLLRKSKTEPGAAGVLARR